MAEHLRTVEAFFSSHHINLKRPWLQEAIHYVSSMGKSNSDNLINLVYQQWLFTDIKHSTAPINGLQKEIDTECFDEPHIFQIQSVSDIGTPNLKQYKRFTDPDYDETMESAAHQPNNANSDTGYSCFSLQLSDGTFELKAFEKKRVHALRIDTCPGSKVLIYGRPEIRHGYIFLSRENCQLLGGAVDHLLGINNAVRTLCELLNKPMPKAKQQPSPAPMPKAKQQPPLPLGESGTLCELLNKPMPKAKQQPPLPLGESALNRDEERRKRFSGHACGGGATGSPLPLTFAAYPATGPPSAAGRSRRGRGDDFTVDDYGPPKRPFIQALATPTANAAPPEPPTAPPGPPTHLIIDLERRNAELVAENDALKRELHREKERYDDLLHREKERYNDLMSLFRASQGQQQPVAQCPLAGPSSLSGVPGGVQQLSGLQQQQQQPAMQQYGQLLLLRLPNLLPGANTIGPQIE